MIRSKIISVAWKEMAYEVIHSAKLKWTIADFKQHCKKQEKTIEKSYETRIAILNSFIDQGIVLINQNVLSIGLLPKNGDLYNSLLAGDDLAWQLISETFPEADEQILFDDTLLKEIGAKGEMFVLDQLTSALPPVYHTKIDQVSKRDDTVGYDIATPSVKDFYREMYLEVKTTNNPNGNFMFYISSNEYKISQKNYDKWYLVLVKLVDNIPKLVGHITSEVLTDKMPNNCNERVRWKSAKINTNSSWIKDGLP